MSRDDHSPILEETRDATDEGGATIRAFPGSNLDRAEEHSPVVDRRPASPAFDVPAEGTSPGAGERDAAPARKGGVSRLLLPVFAAALLAGGAWYGHHYWTVGRFMVSTDDAYLRADIAAIAPKIQGYVDQIEVKENQRVKAGDVLVRLDDGDYRIALEQAQAAIRSQRETLNRIEAQAVAARASVQQALAGKEALQATATNAEATAKRARSLLKTNFASQAEVDKAEAALATAKAKIAGADAGIAAAKAHVAVLKAQYGEAESRMRTLELNVSQAKRNLDLTVLRAPFDGIVGNRSVERGDLVSPGQKLAAIVPVRSLYVEANLKETQLADVVPGEKVKVSIDALDGRQVEGAVASVAPASGSVFSLLPPENATGNFTKVVQRVPVRIALPATAFDGRRLRAGLSVVVDIDTRTAPTEVAAR